MQLQATAKQTIINVYTRIIAARNLFPRPALEHRRMNEQDLNSLYTSLSNNITNVLHNIHQQSICVTTSMTMWGIFLEQAMQDTQIMPQKLNRLLPSKELEGIFLIITPQKISLSLHIGCHPTTIWQRDLDVTWDTDVSLYNPDETPRCAHIPNVLEVGAQTILNLGGSSALHRRLLTSPIFYRVYLQRAGIDIPQRQQLDDTTRRIEHQEWYELQTENEPSDDEAEPDAADITDRLNDFTDEEHDQEPVELDEHPEFVEHTDSVSSIHIERDSIDDDVTRNAVPAMVEVSTLPEEMDNKVDEQFTPTTKTENKPAIIEIAEVEGVKEIKIKIEKMDREYQEMPETPAIVIKLEDENETLGATNFNNVRLQRAGGIERVGVEYLQMTPTNEVIDGQTSPKRVKYV